MAACIRPIESFFYIRAGFHPAVTGALQDAGSSPFAGNDQT